MEENQDELSVKEKELIETIANLEQDKENLTGEIKELRQKREPQKQVIEEAPKPGTIPDPRDVVLSVLAERDGELVKTNLELAKAEIRKTIKELSPDVDKEGILFNKLERELSKFNLNGLKSKEDFTGRLKEAYRLMSVDKPANDKVDFYQGADDTKGAEVRADEGVSLTAMEQKFIQDEGWTKDRYLAVKAKRPTYVASLLKYR